MASISTFVKSLRDIMRNDSGINGDAQRIEQITWMLFLKVYSEKEKEWKFEDSSWISIIPEECQWQNWAHDDFTGKAITGDKLLEFVNNTLFPTLKNLEVTNDTPIKKSIVKTTFEDANNYMKDGALLRQVLNVIDGIDLGDYEQSHAFGEIYESILRELQSAGSSGEFYTPRAVTEFMAEMVDPQIGEKMADFACGTGGFLTSWIHQLEKKVQSTADREALGSSIYGIEKKQFPYMLCITNMLLHGVDVPQIHHDNSLAKNVLDYTEKDKFDVILMNPPYGGNEKADIKSHFPSDLASSETADLFMAVIMYRLKKNGRAAVVLPDGFLFGADNAKIALKKKLINEFNLHTIIRLPGSVFAPYTSIATNLLFFDNTEPTKETWFYRMDMPNGYKHFSKTKPIESKHFDEIRRWMKAEERFSTTEDFKNPDFDLWNNIRHKRVVTDGEATQLKMTAEEIIDANYNLDQCGFPQEEKEILSPEETIVNFITRREVLEKEIDAKLEELKQLLEMK